MDPVVLSLHERVAKSETRLEVLERDMTRRFGDLELAVRELQTDVHQLWIRLALICGGSATVGAAVSPLVASLFGH